MSLVTMTTMQNSGNSVTETVCFRLTAAERRFIERRAKTGSGP
jgi:hypothetical protein